MPVGLGGIGRRVGIGVGVGCALALAASPVAHAKVVACEEPALNSAISAAKAGEVLHVGAGSCTLNVEITNPEPFTIEGTAPGTTLEPAVTTKPIILGKKPASGLLTFTLAHLTLTGTTNASAVAIETEDEAITVSDDTFIADKKPSGGGAALEFSQGKQTTSLPTVISGNRFGEAGAGNQALYGGAVQYIGANPVEFIGNVFESNAATEPTFGTGGALAFAGFASGGGPVTLRANTFGGAAPGAGNTTTRSGGGAFIELNGKQTLASSSA